MHILTVPNDFVRATSDDWRDQMRTAIRDVDHLRRALDLPPANEPAVRRAEQQFGTFVPLAFLQRMQRGNERDPLLLQVLPVSAEHEDHPGFSRDPVREFDLPERDHIPTVRSQRLAADGPTPGILQKYAGRALLVLSGVCAVHCRYCFRRHFPYESIPKSRSDWMLALNEIAADSSCRELIFSGGDPLTIVDEHLEELIHRAVQIPHLQRLRIHTRLPTVIPQRVTEALCAVLSRAKLPIAFVWHINHPLEIDDAVRAAAARLKRIDNVTQFNQSVLLRGVNDQTATLVDLSERLFDAGVIPYYLHQLDRVHGAAHFEVPIAAGIEIVRAMRSALPGYLVPRYVAEYPGEPSKTVLA